MQKTEDTQIAVMANDISYIKKAISDLSAKIDDNYITRQEFEPIRKLVYGLVALILTGVVGGLLTLIIQK